MYHYAFVAEDGTWFVPESVPGRQDDGMGGTRGRPGGLVTAALHGEFAQLVRRHQDSLYRYGRGLGLDHDTALDLVQEAFVKAHARLDQCRGPSGQRALVAVPDLPERNAGLGPERPPDGGPAARRGGARG